MGFEAAVGGGVEDAVGVAAAAIPEDVGATVALFGFPIGGLAALVLRLTALGLAALVLASLAAERVRE